MEIISDPLPLVVTSPAFVNGGEIPTDYGCRGKGINPEIHIQGIPSACHTLAIIMEDPDATGKTYDHWIAFDIAPVEIIGENVIPGIVGKNTAGENNYHPPCPPNGKHRYYFKIYALDALLYLDHNADKQAVLTALESHVLAYGEIMGYYSHD